MSPGGETAGALAERLSKELGSMLPKLAPYTHPRGMPTNTDEVLEMCSARWRADFGQLKWKIANIAPVCLHCSLVADTDAFTNAILGVDGPEGEMPLEGLVSHLLKVNGVHPSKASVVQSALNLSHSIKVLASNMPCKVDIAPSDVPQACVKALSELGSGAKKATDRKRKSTGAKSEGSAEEFQDIKTPKSGKKRKSVAAKEEEVPEVEIASFKTPKSGKKGAREAGGDSTPSDQGQKSEKSGKKGNKTPGSKTPGSKKKALA